MKRLRAIGAMTYPPIQQIHWLLTVCKACSPWLGNLDLIAPDSKPGCQKFHIGLPTQAIPDFVPWVQNLNFKQINCPWFCLQGRINIQSLNSGLIINHVHTLPSWLESVSGSDSSISELRRLETQAMRRWLARRRSIALRAPIPSTWELMAASQVDTCV